MDVCMDVWMYGCMDVWMYVCMDVCMYGCMDVWMYGCMDVWMHVYICVGGQMILLEYDSDRHQKIKPKQKSGKSPYSPFMLMRHDTSSRLEAFSLPVQIYELVL